MSVRKWDGTNWVSEGHQELLNKIKQIEYSDLQNMYSFINENSRDAQPSRLRELHSFVDKVRDLL